MVSIGLSSLCQYLHPPTNKEIMSKESPALRKAHMAEMCTHTDTNGKQGCLR